MTMPTKAQIDALVEAMPSGGAYTYGIGSTQETVVIGGSATLQVRINRDDLRRALYLAAGLTAEGEPKPKPERVRCRMIVYPSGNWTIFSREDGFCSDPPDGQYVGGRAIPGTFVPDGAA